MLWCDISANIVVWKLCFIVWVTNPGTIHGEVLPIFSCPIKSIKREILVFFQWPWIVKCLKTTQNKKPKNSYNQLISGHILLFNCGLDKQPRWPAVPVSTTGGAGHSFIYFTLLGKSLQWTYDLSHLAKPVMFTSFDWALPLPNSNTTSTVTLL